MGRTENPFSHAGVQLTLFVLMVLSGRTTCEAVDALIEGAPTREKMRIFDRALKHDPVFKGEWIRVFNYVRGVSWNEEDHAQHRAYMDANEPEFHKFWASRGGMAQVRQRLNVS